MNGSKIIIKNCGTKVIYFNYQSLSPNILYNQVSLFPGQTKTIVCVTGSFNYSPSQQTINILSNTPYTP